MPAGGGGSLPALPQQRALAAAHSNGYRGFHHAPAKVGEQGRARGPAKAGCLGLVCCVCCRGAGLLARVCLPGFFDWRPVCAGLCRRQAAVCSAVPGVGPMSYGLAGGALARARLRRLRGLHSLSGAFPTSAGLRARARRCARRARAPAVAGPCSSVRSCERCRSLICLRQQKSLHGRLSQRPLLACLLCLVPRSRVRARGLHRGAQLLGATFYCSERVFISVLLGSWLCVCLEAGDFFSGWAVSFGDQSGVALW